MKNTQLKLILQKNLLKPQK